MPFTLAEENKSHENVGCFSRPVWPGSLRNFPINQHSALIGVAKWLPIESGNLTLAFLLENHGGGCVCWVDIRRGPLRFPEMGSWAWVHGRDAITKAVERASLDPEFHPRHPRVRYFVYSLFPIARVSCFGVGVAYRHTPDNPGHRFKRILRLWRGSHAVVRIGSKEGKTRKREISDYMPAFSPKSDAGSFLQEGPCILPTSTASRRQVSLAYPISPGTMGALLGGGLLFS